MNAWILYIDLDQIYQKLSELTNMANMLFDPKQFLTLKLTDKYPKCETIENIHMTVIIRMNCYELGNTVVFEGAGGGSVYSMNKNPIIFSFPMSDILSVKSRTEKKRFSKKSFLTIKTAKHTIDIGNMEGDESCTVEMVKEFLDTQKEKEVLGNKSKEITFTADGSTKTLTICPYSPTALDSEEILYSRMFFQRNLSPRKSFVVTNYRVWQNNFFGTDGISLTHDEYDEVIATNVSRERDEDIYGDVDADDSDGMTVVSWETKHHASSTETEYGDIIFMKDGKRVTVWDYHQDPNSMVKLINAAKAHFSTAPAASSSSGGEDPIKALKLRFAKGEITKEEFLDMKSMLE